MRRLLVPAIVVAAAAVFAVDVCLNGVNLSILYLVLLALLGLQNGRVSLARPTMCFVALALVGFLIKCWLWEAELPPLSSYRFLNRLLVSVTLLLMVPIMRLVASSPPADGRRDEFEGLLSWLVPALGLLMAVSLLLVVAITDALTPSGFNVPILYSVVLFLAMGARHRGLIWAAFVTVAVLAVLGFFLGEASNHLFLVNRMISVGAMLVLTAGAEFWLRSHKAVGQHR